MPKELDSRSVKIDQKPDLTEDDLKDRKPEIVRAGENVLASREEIEALAFNEEPVTIRLMPSADKNAMTSYPVSVNGVNAEVLMNDRWVQMDGGYLPVGRTLTTKRKYLAVLVSAKIDTINTKHSDPSAEIIQNRIQRMTTPIAAVSVIEDRNPRGAPWLQELIRRNM